MPSLQDRRQYVDLNQDWKPRWGFRRANNPETELAREVRPGQDSNVLPVSTKAAKKERVARNELNRLQNVARSLKLKKMPTVGLTPTETPDHSHVTKARAFARLSTASMGKFTDRLPKEKQQDRLGKRRQFLPNYSDSVEEKARSLDILNSVMTKRPKMDVTTAANRQILEEDRRPKKRDANKRRSKTGLNVAKAKKGHRSSKLGRRNTKSNKRARRK